MLNQIRTLQKLECIVSDLVPQNSSQLSSFLKVWLALSADQTFKHFIKNKADYLQLTHWIGNLGEITTIPILGSAAEYEVIAVDGSQIYPDRHYSIACFLINIGEVVLRYGAEVKQRVMFDSVPYVFPGFIFNDGSYDCSRVVVNCVRQEFEFNHALQLSNQSTELPRIVLLDGSLIFWHLLSQEERVKDHFLPKYIQSLEAFHKKNTPIIGYISMPKSKDIISLIKHAIEEKYVVLPEEDSLLCETNNSFVDATLMNRVLPVHHRTTLFQYRGDLQKLYHEESCPYFFYLNTGAEIARVELPAWVARNSSLVDLVTKILLDQCIKGNGYPIALAESHEQAVVKGPDRDWFYQSLTNIINKTNHSRSILSSKSQKKARMPV